MTTDPRQQDEKADALRTDRASGATLLALMTLCFLLAAARAGVFTPGTLPADPARSASALGAELVPGITDRATAATASAESVLVRLDPNLAPWWELAALPQLGETRARAVVAYREAHAPRGAAPVFTNPADLRQVPGIGPKTVERVAGHLRFDPP